MTNERSSVVLFFYYHYDEFTKIPSKCYSV